MHSILTDLLSWYGKNHSSLNSAVVIVGAFLAVPRFWLSTRATLVKNGIDLAEGVIRKANTEVRFWLHSQLEGHPQDERITISHERWIDVLEVLNELEAAAVSIRRRGVDESTVRTLCRGTLVYTWSILAPTVLNQRLSRDRPQMFRELEWLAIRWATESEAKDFENGPVLDYVVS